MRCKTYECENERYLSDNPEWFLISIPFTNIEIRIYNWNRKREEDYCIDCLCEIDKHKNDDMLDSFYQSGYEKGLEQGAQGEWDSF